MSRTVPPLMLSPGSVVDDILGFIRNAVPDLRQGQGDGNAAAAGSEPAGSAATPPKEQVAWVSFESIAADDLKPEYDLKPDECGELDLLLIGYTDGFQVWDISNKQNVHELLSLREVHVSSVTLLPPPRSRNGAKFEDDRFATARPLLALCDNDLHSKQPVRLMSLRTGDFLTYEFSPSGPPPVMSVIANTSVVAVVSHSSITVRNAATLEPLTKIADCMAYTDPNRGWGLTPAALGARWLAYATTGTIDVRTSPHKSVQSADKHRGPGAQAAHDDKVAAIVGMAQKTGTELWYLGGAGMKVVSDLMNGIEPDPATARSGNGGNRGAFDPLPEHKAAFGMVRVMVLPDVSADTNDQNGQPGKYRTLAHFRANTGKRPLAVMAFDPSGTLLATADTDGQAINVFHVGIKGSSGLAMVLPQHIYTLNRGVTAVLLRQIQFSPDSRWVAVVSDRGTTHLFAIMPSGGRVRSRTHTQATVPSSDRFQTSADISEAATLRMAPVVVKGAKAKLKHVPPQTSSRTATTAPFPEAEPQSETRNPHLTVAKRLHGSIASCFGGYSCHAARAHGHGQQPHFPLFVATMGGALIEHRFYPHVNDDVAKSKTEKAATEAGGIVVTDNGALTRTIKTVGQVIEGARDIVARLRPQDQQAAGSHGNGTHGNGHRPKLAPSDDLGVVCVAHHWWDVCRMKDWVNTARNLQGNGPPGPPGQPPDLIGNFHGHNPAARPAQGSDNSHNQAWLAHVELSTYQAPHRRLWMGPQFTFRRFDEFESDGAMKATCLTSALRFKTPACIPALALATPGRPASDGGRGVDAPSPEEIQNDMAEAMGL